MANTGNKVYRKLEEYVVSTGAATGNEKLNWDGDSDYIAPVTDTTSCPTKVIQPATWTSFSSSSKTSFPSCGSNLYSTFYEHDGDGAIPVIGDQIRDASNQTTLNSGYITYDPNSLIGLNDGVQLDSNGVVIAYFQC